jgi:3-oxoacyl-(acyl-carrier-protein) synthase
VVERLLLGERAATESPLFDARSYPCRLGAAVAPPLPSRHRRFLRRLGLLALEAAAEALSHARSAPGFPAVPGERLGLFFGYGGLRAHWEDVMPALAGLGDPELPLTATWQRGLKLLHPFWMLLHLSNNAHALCAEELRILGEGVTYGGANAGAQALAGAQAALAVGAVDVALVVAHDSLIEPEVLIDLGMGGGLAAGGLAALRAPYDAAAAGYVPGQATAALVLERPLAAGARALLWVDAVDGSDGQSGEPDATALAAVAGRLGGLAAIRVLDGAARARPEFDWGERTALAALLAPDAVLTAGLSGLGQVGAAAALLQTITLGIQLRRGLLAPVAGLLAAPRGPLPPLCHPLPTTATAALALSVGTPGLLAAVRVEVPR